MLFGMKVCLLVALVVAPAATTPFPKNYEYSATKIDRFPHHASVRSIVDTKHYCSAAIISERWLLSSAQCTQGEHDVAGNIFIVVGVTSVNKDGDRYNIAEIINHPEYEITKKKRANDIAMLKTVENIRMKLSGVHPISLPSYKSHYLIENPIGLIPATVTGWSEYKQTETPHPDAELAEILHMQKSDIRNRQSCRRHLGRVNGQMFNENHLCTVFTDQVCLGDTGSPLINEHKEIIGIASWHRLTPCGNGFPKIYTYVYSYIEWISETMNTV